ncbi:MAG: NADPH:quinone oxidoreductase family protein [Amylibacter sp.]|nr:NADPH:quinone oxidoreductase family protein [Amylibacter sp.]
MQAIQVTNYDKTVELRDIAIPEIAPDQVLVRVAACALNFGDLLLVKGTYQEKPALPFTLGMELSGTVEKIGADVTTLSVGQRIISYTGFDGLAEYAAIPADICLPIPDSMDMIDAAAFPVGYGTAHLALDYRARLQPKERLLVLGASGGVGLTAVELGKLMGAEVIAVARNAEKLEIARQAGADHLINSETTDLRETVKALGGADVVYDPVGGDQFTAAMRATNPDGRLIPLGFASGSVPQIPANHLLVKNLTVIGYYWGGYSKVNPKVLADSLATLLNWYDTGKIKPHVSHVLPLAETQKGLDLLRARKATGKVVIKVE